MLTNTVTFKLMLHQQDWMLNFYQVLLLSIPGLLQEVPERCLLLWKVAILLSHKIFLDNLTILSFLPFLWLEIRTSKFPWIGQRLSNVSSFNLNLLLSLLLSVFLCLLFVKFCLGINNLGYYRGGSSWEAFFPFRDSLVLMNQQNRPVRTVITKFHVLT